MAAKQALDENKTLDELVRADIRQRRRQRFRGQGATAKKPKSIKPTEITRLIYQLTNMIKAGIPLIQALDLIAEGFQQPALHSLIKGIRQKIAAGHSLTAALQDQPNYFDTLLCSLVDIGEQTGTLEAMLTKIVGYREKSAALRQYVRSALTYPAAVTLVAVGITVLMLVKVVPQFESMFHGFGAQLPAFTQVVVHLSELARHHWLEVFTGVCSTILAIRYGYRKNARLKLSIDRLALNIPLIGPLIQKTILARYAYTLATSFNAGAPLLTTLRMIATSTGNSFYNNVIVQIADEVAAGQSLHLAMSHSNAFPAMMIQMVTTGEEAGSLVQLLNKACEYYELEVEATLSKITHLLEPAIMCLLGLLTGGLIIAMYLPVFSLGGVLGGAP